MSKAGTTALNGDLQGSQCILKTPKGKKKVREQSENIIRRNVSISRAASQLNNGEIVETVTLFEVVSMGKRAIQSVVDDWIEAYKEDRDTALLDLINFFIQCSGCQGMVTAEMFQSLHNSTVMKKMTEDFDEETGLQYKKFMAYPWILTVTWPMVRDSEIYPLIKPGSYWKKFKTNFCEMIVVLVQQSQYNIIYDGYLMDTVISLLTGLADSKVRALRHTSTLAAMKLLTALVSVTVNLHVSINNNRRLYEVEKSRLNGKRTNYRLDQLEKKKEELQQKCLEIQNMINAIFKGAFLQRCRDIVPEIRALCIEELGVWMKICPHMFLNDSYLKYIGWMLNDKQPDVRLKSLLGLQGLYDKKKLVSKMDLFTNRFKDRIVSMTLDRDQEVAVQAMKLLLHMSENCEDVFMSEDCEILYQFVYAAHRPLAAAAGEFLYKRLFNHQGAEEELRYEKKEKFGQNARYIKRLLIFFLENELHDHVTYLVDSLWDCASCLMKDWKCMTTLLLEDYREEEEGLSDAQKSALIEVIIASVKQAVECHPPTGRGLTRKVLSAKEKKLQFEDCTRITEHFIVVLPQLLSKYSAHADEVANLLQIPQHFDLDIYTTGHLEKHLDALLRQLKDIAEKHSDLKVLEACSRTYDVLCKEELIIHSQVSLARNQLIEEFVIKLIQLLDELLQEREDLCANEGGICQISSSLRRVAAFHNAHDLTRWNMYNRISQLLDLEMEHRSLPIQIVLPALQCIYYALLWQLTTVMERNSSKETLLLLRAQTVHFCEICRFCLSHNNKTIQEQAFTLLCDLLMILSYQESSEDDILKVLSYSPDLSFQSELLTFVQEHVFMQENKEMTEGWEKREEDDRKLNDLHKRRRFLSNYCKLIVYNVVEMATATEIYKHYMKSYDDFGDIIKETLSRTRQHNQTESAKTLVLCLQQLFEKNMEDPSMLLNMKELARRFSLTFGLDQVKCRESVTMIHKEGIEFAFKEAAAVGEKLPPSNLSFLLIISEFSSKLLKPDKRLVNGYLQRYITEQMLLQKGDEWHPLIFYNNSLLASEDEESSTAGSLSSRECSSISRSNTSSFKRKLSDACISEISHTEPKNGPSHITWTSHLTCTSVTSKKKQKSYEKNFQELYAAELRRRLSWSTTQVEKSPADNKLISLDRHMEDGNEEVDVDVIDGDQENSFLRSTRSVSHKKLYCESVQGVSKEAMWR